MTIKKGLWQIVAHGRETGTMLVLFISIGETWLEPQIVSLLDSIQEMSSNGLLFIFTDQYHLTIDYFIDPSLGEGD